MKNGKVAHTDLVKCFSNAFPFAGMRAKDERQVVANCSDYLIDQLTKYKPDLIICNGSQVCHHIKRIVQPIDEQNPPTRYKGKIEGEDQIFNVILSGFIGRIDNYAKRRLGLDIEQVVKEEISDSYFDD